MDLSKYSIAEKQEILAILEAKEAISARESLAKYAELTLEVIPARHHLLLIDALEEVEQGMLDVLIVTMPPGSAKSTYCSVAFPAWYIGRHPERCVIAASHTAELAERFGRRVRNIVGSPEHLRAFPLGGLSEDSTAAGRWDTKRGGEYFAAGVGGSVTGRRADLAIIDDPVKSREDADSETIREKQWAWWRDDMSTRLKPGAATVLIMTRWHEQDLAGRMIADLKQSGQRVKVLSLPMEAMDNDPLGREIGDPLWPEWFTSQMIENAKREPRTWSALYQQEPRPIGGGEFKIEWLSYFIQPPANINKIILVDPSSGKSRTRGDYTSMWVVGSGADGNDYVVDGLRDRLNLTERTDALFKLVRKHKPAAVGYEQYGLQADIEHIKTVQESQQYRFKIIELGGAVKKEDRIRRLIPSFQQSRIWMPQSMKRQMVDGHIRDIMDDFKSEFLSFPVGAHDDALDCLARKEESEMRKFLTAPKRQEQEDRYDSFIPLDSEFNY
jgi:phage terminase large subunit-like protein